MGNLIKTVKVRYFHYNGSAPGKFRGPGKYYAIRSIYTDKPASLETWFENCERLAKEFGVPVAEIHRILYLALPEIIGK